MCSEFNYLHVIQCRGPTSNTPRQLYQLIKFEALHGCDMRPTNIAKLSEIQQNDSFQIRKKIMQLKLEK